MCACLAHIPSLEGILVNWFCLLLLKDQLITQNKTHSTNYWDCLQSSTTAFALNLRGSCDPCGSHWVVLVDRSPSSQMVRENVVARCPASLLRWDDKQSLKFIVTLCQRCRAKETVLSADSLSDASSASLIWRARGCIHLDILTAPE